MWTRAGTLATPRCPCRVFRLFLIPITGVIVSQFNDIAPDHSPWHIALQRFHSGRYHEAYDAVQSHLATQPECGRGWELLGQVCHSQKRWGAALEAFEQATVRVPLSAEAECNLADCYRFEGRTGWARGLYHHLIRRVGVEVCTLLNAATGLDDLTEPRMSIVACQRAIRLDPEFAQSYFDMAYYLRRCGASVATVEASARRAICLAPNDIVYRVGLSTFLHAQDRTDDAALLLKYLTRHHVQQLKCNCCVARLMDVLTAVGDHERDSWCRDQLESIPTNDREHS